VGDFTALGEFAEMAAKAGAATVGLNPLHVLFSQDRERASPYYPSDRRFLDPIYIDVTALDGPSARAALASCPDQIARLSALPDVDYPGVWALKRAILEASFADFERLCVGSPCRDFEDFVDCGGASLAQFACFEAIGETRNGGKWPGWPAALRDRDPGALANFTGENAAPVRFHLYLQWVADQQFRKAAERGKAGGSWLGFYRDLAVGAAPDGAEIWANADQFLASTSIGAPPDPFAEGGQNWGLKAPNPLAWRRSNYRLFREVLSANMAGAGALRIDHAMGLTRLFVIPNGAEASEGAYLAFPERDLIAELALESVRARCVIVGEDLGTVPENFRATMDAANILSYRVMWFEREGSGFAAAESYPRKSVACVTTHDLPTIAGWWQGEDIREKEALKLIPPEAAEAARKERALMKRAFLRAIGLEAHTSPDYMPPLASIVAAAHEFIQRTPSLIAIAQIDDLVGEFTGVNLPGTDQERPNWRRKLKGTIAGFASSVAALQSGNLVTN
jgi:glycogen operon protein